MNALDGIDGLSECIGRAIQEHLAKSNINIAWPQIDSLDRPVLRFEAFIEDAGQSSNATRPRSEKIASVCVPVHRALHHFRSVYPATLRSALIKY